jgi:hypothetical protein
MALFFGTGCAESDDMTWQPPEPVVIGIHILSGLAETGYTLDQLLAVRQQTIDECAKVCDEVSKHQRQFYSPAAAVSDECADAIRKLGGLT